eukprot:scaffold138567_cov31-Attheya_sp.AAC.1
MGVPNVRTRGPSRHVDRFSITTADHISGWKRSRENTAPGHSGLTCAHWKASCESPLLASLDAS